MPLIILRLIPKEPVSAEDFAGYLNGLSIAVHELSLADPGGTGAALGSADYLAPTLPVSPGGDVTPDPDPNTRVTQHFRIDPDPVSGFERTMFAVATAVIEVPAAAAGTEHETRDIRLVVTRNGTELVHRRRYFNVPMSTAALPADPNDFAGLEPVSLHLSLPAPGQATGPGVTVPEDGTAPAFAALRAAVEDVLSDEPGTLAGIADLTLADARHVAREIVWDRAAFPLPVPNRSLEQIYTGPHSAGSDEERDRLLFEGDLTTYYVAHDAEPDRLAAFVFALSAAIWCERQSAGADLAGFVFPVLPWQMEVLAQVHLDGPGAGPLVPDFGVRAEYFYALTALLPPQIARPQRYDMTVLQPEAQSLAAIAQALEDKVIAEPAGMTRFQAARRLAALGRAAEPNVPLCPVAPGSDAQALVAGWLGVAGDSTAGFWATLTPPQVAGHLEVALSAITHAHAPLMAAIRDPAFGVDEIGDLANRSDQDWMLLFAADPGRLPPFTAPGTLEERVQAFLRNLRRFFQVSAVVEAHVPPPARALPALPRSPGNPVDLLLQAMPAFSFANWNEAAVAGVVAGLFPGDPGMQAQFVDWLRCIRGTLELTEGIAPDPLRLSVTEALWARGILRARDLDGMSQDDLRGVLRGGPAFDHAAAILANAQAAGAEPPLPAGPFTPVNPDGSLANCLAPGHLSPLGPVGYLQDLIRLTPDASCAAPFPDTETPAFAERLAGRRGDIAPLLASPANLSTPLPLIDLINESLEHMVAAAAPGGIFRNTARDTLGGHPLDSAAAPQPGAHEAATLFEALPEHSTPAAPLAEPDAWARLREDFSSCHLPYDQPVDVTRSYLAAMGTSRFATMRHFRHRITEWVLDPAAEPPAFRSHLWRLPVRFELALEYLGLTPAEAAVLFAAEGPDAHALPLHYGFAPGGEDWMAQALHLPVFLDRTCLTYCEFREMMESGFLRLSIRSPRTRVATSLPPCEPCCLDEFFIHPDDPEDPALALLMLDRFIRLWRRLNDQGHALGFAQLADLAEVLGMFVGGMPNPDFPRQLAAFLMLRDMFGLPMTDGTPPVAGATGAERLHLLSFWAPGAARFDWALRQLMDAIQRHALRHHGCGCRPPEFLRLLRENLDPISRLAGFDPGNPAERWQARPTHTLRLAEVLAKIYASGFGVGEILFLFSAGPQLQGDEPFPLQTPNEARDLPFELPDDEEAVSLFALRRALLEVEAGDGAGLTWAGMGGILHRRFGLPLPPGDDRWLRLGQHFFPGVLEAEGTPVPPADRRHAVPLAGTSADMWNTGGGPFRFDAAAGTLSVSVGFTDAEVLAKLARIRQLNPAEQAAVTALYLAPRRELAFFSFLWDDPAEAEARLVAEPDERARWRWFQAAFARFLARCDAIAAHLARLVQSATGTRKEDGAAAADLILARMWATENFALGPWESDSGDAPPVTWQPPPRGGAYHALLGVAGTGLLAEYRGAGGVLRWREPSGVDVFGPARNAANAPLPPLVPAMGTALPPGVELFAAIRNGFALANADGAALGGAEPFTLALTGLLLIERGGTYRFAAGVPTGPGEMPDARALRRFHRWRVRLSRGQKSWVVLAHGWPEEEAPADCAAPLRLDRGFYDLSIEFERLPPALDGPEDLCPQTTGFQLKYEGPDADDGWTVIPRDRLFVERKDAPLSAGIDNAPDAIRAALDEFYLPTVRDMRATFQRAAKALLFAWRLDLSARPVADDGQSELGYMLSHPDAFQGQSHSRGGGVQTHRVDFDVNLLPWSDGYAPPDPAVDERTAPSVRRMQAWFDIWERLSDYARMRAATGRSPERPVWLLFHEAGELHEDNPAHLLRHMGVDLRHADIVRLFHDPDEADLTREVTSADLIDDRWAIRVWRADLWLRALRQAFHPRRIRAAQPHLWASAGPEPAGVEGLTRFFRDGCIENGEPRRYLEIRRLNDGLRERGRRALVAWATRLDRIALPWGGFARNARDLSDLLLMDVQAGLCQKLTRIDEAVGVLQLFVNRHRLGLEGVALSPAFLALWDSRFADFRRWQACRRREIYRENWIDLDRTAEAQPSEAFAFLQDELRRDALTLARPGGLVHWPGPRPPAHDGLALLQEREPATMSAIVPARQGLGLAGWPDRDARPAWLAPLDTGGRGGQDGPILAMVGAAGPRGGTADEVPMWFRAAVGLGTTFLRVAAAATPPAATAHVPGCDRTPPDACCAACGRSHPALMDEYYFWLEESEIYRPVEQVAEWGAVPDDVVTGEIGDPKSDWHRPDRLPGLLRWEPRRSAHLHWCRVHNGEFQPRRRSAEGIEVAFGQTPNLVLLGREGDSLNFSVTGGLARVGHPADPDQPFPPPGFRYDIAPDDAVVLPEVVTAPPPDPVGGLSGFPFFGWHAPGAPVLPRRRFAVATATAAQLATLCRHDAARGWLGLLWRPLEGDNRWMDCDPPAPPPSGGDTQPGDTVPGDDTVPGVTILRAEIRDGTPGLAAAPRLRPRRCCCPSAPVPDSVAERRHLTMRHLDLMLDEADTLMRRGTPEAFGHARLLVDTAHRVLGDVPQTVLSTEAPDPDQPVAEATLACPPLNPRLMCLYTRTEDRLGLIHACLNARRLREGAGPWAGDDRLRECWKLDGAPCLDDAFGCRPASPYRFEVLVARARDLAAETRNLGTALLSAYEKGDAEHLQALRVRHERQIDDLILAIRQDQWRDLDWMAQSLEKAKALALNNLTYYRNLVAAGLLTGESQHEPLTITSTSLRTAGNVVEAIGQAMNVIPDPNVGFPVSFLTLPPGKKLAMIFAASGMIARTASDIVSTSSGLGLTKDGWTRREDEWVHLAENYALEVEKIERERLATLRRRDAALRELNNHRQMMQNAAEVQDYLRDKFTGHALYLWLQSETAALHHRLHDLALHCAWAAQRAYNLERGHSAERFVSDDAWDSLHEGLLAGERLSLALNRMEKAFHDGNRREYEITRHLSLREEFPVAFLQLQATGECEISVPEWIFDLDWPGHYMRRIRTLSLSLPGVTGPYSSINCRMTLLSSRTRVSPELTEPWHRCCDDAGCNNGYPPLPQDSRFVETHVAADSIVTSAGLDDHGMFQVRFDDPRYLPFEYAGAACRLRLELPPAENRFDLDTLRDVVLHMRYTAREGGDRLREAARDCARRRLPGDGLRLIDARRETGDEWRALPGCDDQALLGLPLSRAMLPFLTGDRQPRVERIELLIEAPEARPGTHLDLIFHEGAALRGFDPATCAEGVQTVTALGDAAWPGFFHAAIRLAHPHPLRGEGRHDLGVLRFPLPLADIGSVHLLYGYSARDARP